MKVQELTVDIKARLEISKSTAEACLKIVQEYVNATDNNIIVNRESDGFLYFGFER